jgi:hypothetical protein
MNKTLSYLLIITVLMLTGCEKYALFDSGEHLVEDRSLSDFSSILVNDIFNITIANDTINHIQVIGGSNVVSQVFTEVKEGRLVLTNEVKAKWSRDYEKIELVIYCKNLQEIELREPSKVITKGVFTGDKLMVWCLGITCELNMDVDLNRLEFVTRAEDFDYCVFKGEVGYLNVWNRGASKFFADSLNVNEAYITNNSIADLYVNVSNKLSVVLDRPGNIYYTGNPSIEIVKQSSSGKLIKVDK